MKLKSPFLSLITFCAVLFAGALNCLATTATVTLDRGTVIRLALSARTPIGKVGEEMEARVAQPVYSYDRLVIPAGTRVFGTITALIPVSRRERILAMTGGDFTPMRDPVIRFDRIELANGEIVRMDTAATHTNTKIVELKDRESRDESLLDGAKGMAKEKLGLNPEGPGKLDLIKNELFSYLPYHPQHLDRGSLLDAVLTKSLEFDLTSEGPADHRFIGRQIPDNTLIHARLLTELSSKKSRRGDRIEAVLTQPIWDLHGELLYPEGTRLLGSVINSKRAGWFGRSGELRIVFRSLQLSEGTEEAIKGQIEALDTQRNENVMLDAEGGTRAHLNNRLLSPMINYVLADYASKPSSSRIKRAVVSNGFKIVGRIAGFFGTPDVATGFSYVGLGRSIYTNIINKGPDTTFPVNTRLELRVSPRLGRAR